MESKLAGLLQTKPLASGNDRFVFFDLRAYKEGLRGSYTEEELKARRERSLHPVILSWKPGFSDLEVGPDINWRWCSSAGELHIYNGMDRSRPLLIEMNLSTGYGEFASMSIAGPGFSDTLKINSAGVPYAKEIVLQPGTNIIKFNCDARRVQAPGDPRDLVFRVVNFNFRES
jgi:hypothetical protein